MVDCRWRRQGSLFIASSELGFHTAKDYEDPDDADGDGIYLLRVQVSDGSHDVSSDLWVQLRDVNEGAVDPGTPVISTLGPFHINEGERDVALLEATDGQGDPLSWSIVDGDDESHFSIVAGGVSNNAGELSFNEAKDFESPDDANGDGVYLLTVEVDDGTNTAQANLLVRLQDVNEAPALETSRLQVESGQDGSLTLKASVDTGERVNWSIVGGDDESHFSLTSEGELSFNEAKSFESPDDSDGDGIYEVEVLVSDGTHTTRTTVQVQLQQKSTQEKEPDDASSVSSNGSSGGSGCGFVTTLPRQGGHQGGEGDSMGSGPLSGNPALWFLAFLFLPLLLACGSVGVGLQGGLL